MQVREILDAALRQVDVCLHRDARGHRGPLRQVGVG